MKFLLVLLGLFIVATAKPTANELVEKRATTGLEALQASLQNILLNVVAPAVTTQLQSAALILAQMLAGVADGGIPALQAIIGGKREIPQDKSAFLDALTSSLNQVLQSVLLPALTTQLQGASLIAAQLLAGIADGGIPAIQSLIGGKRATTGLEALQASLQNILLNVVAPAVTTQLQSAALILAQMLAGVADGGIPALQAIIGGKREIPQDKSAFLDALTSSLNQVLQSVLLPALTTQLQGASLIAAQLLAGIADGGIPAIQSLIGGK